MIMVEKSECYHRCIHKRGHETINNTHGVSSSGSLHYKRSKRMEVIITSILISSCHGILLSRPRTTDEQRSQHADRIITYDDARKLRPQYKSFMEDALDGEETWNSMSLSFDFSGSFKSLMLEDKGDKSLAAGEFH